MTKEEVWSLYQKAFINKIRPIEINSTLDYSSLLKLLKGKVYSSYFEEWKSLGNSTSIPSGDNGQFKAEISVDTLLEAFKARESGELIKDIAERMGFTKTWLNQILLGHQRPEVLKAWRALGKRKLTQKTISKPAPNKIQIECIGVQVFDSVKEAADFAKVSSTALLKAIKQDRPCKGYRFKKF